MAEKKALEEAERQRKANGIMAMFKGNQKEDEGSIEFSLAGLFKVMCCVHPKPNESQRIAETLASLKSSIDRIER